MAHHVCWREVTDIRYIAALDVMEVFGMHETHEEPDPFSFILGLDPATGEDSELSCARQRGAILRAYGEADDIAIMFIFSGAFTWAGDPKGVLRIDQPQGEVATHQRVLDGRSQSQFIKEVAERTGVFSVRSNSTGSSRTVAFGLE